MGKYTPSFSLSDDALTMSAKLTETEVNPKAYTVRIDLANKDQTATVKPEPSLSGNYYVLAYLTPKGSGSRGQVIGWSVVDVDENLLNQNGTWSNTIPQNGFKVCNSDLDATDATMGYDPELFDLNLRLYHSDTSYGTYKEIRDYASDAAPDGFDFQGVFTKDTDPVTGNLKLTEEDTSVIRLHQAYEKEYGIRAYVDTEGLEIPEGEYIVRVKLFHQTGDPTFAFAKLKIEPTTGGSKPEVLEFFKNDKGWYWYDQNATAHSPADNANYIFTGNEAGIEIKILSLKDGSTTDPNGEWTKSPEQTEAWSEISFGDSINLYTVTLGSREMAEDVAKKICYTYDVIRFTKDEDGVTKPELDEALAQALDFGLYTEILSKHATDMESNIGADQLTGEIGADYGFSGNNVRVNTLTVLKRYFTAEGYPVPEGTEVTLKLYPVTEYDEDPEKCVLGTPIEVKGKTGSGEQAGIATLKFDKLLSGTYLLKEFINGTEYTVSADSLTATTADGLTVTFTDKFIEIENINVNYNYFDDIADNVQLPPVITHSRNGVIVVGNQNDFNALVEANGGNEVSNQGEIVLAGEQPAYPKLDIPTDMQNLRDLSVRLGNSGSSQTVRIINTTMATINQNNGLNLKNDGRYIVVNVDMSDAASVATVNLDTYIDGNRLMADFGADGNEDASKVLYNFITRDAHGNVHPYTGKINTATQAAGVLLAPSAIVADLGGNWGGTIICRECQHTGSEIHSDSANKIQNKNTVLTNGVPNNGNLELKKSFSDGTKDRTTWFTFKLTAKKDDSPVTGTYAATGLKDNAASVTFDENGTAEVLVRAQNKVIITGLPLGAEVQVKEISTPATANYELDHMVPENGTVTIDKDTMVSVEAVNKKTGGEKGALKFTKKVTVNGAEILDTATEAQKKAADGDYTFTITGPGSSTTVNKTVVIKVKNGVATQYKIDNADSFTNLPNDKYVVIPDLTPGDYTITETNSGNLTLTSITGGKNGTINVTDKKVIVTVTAGENISGAAIATFTNNIDVGSLEITKIIQANGTTDADAKGTFYYAVYNVAYDSSANPAQSPIATGSIEVTQNGSNTGTVSNLPYGTYYVYELTEENGIPILSGNSSVQAVINNTTYTVTGSGTAAKIDSSTVATATLTNNVETTSMEATKAWKNNGTTIGWPDDIASVDFTLFAKIGDGESNAVAIDDSSISTYFTGITATVTINKDTTGLKASWSNLPTKVLVEAGTEDDIETKEAEWENVTYSVVETKVKYTDSAKAELKTPEDISAMFNWQWDKQNKTITNERKDFEFTKNWKDGLQQTVTWKTGTSITVTVQRKIGPEGTAESVGKYTIKRTETDFVITKDTATLNAPDLARKTGAPDTFQIIGLPARGTIGKVTGEYTYFVTEEAVTGYKTSYQNPNVSGGTTMSSDYAVHKGSIINTPEGGYELPQTGGIGTTLFTALGGLMTATAGAILTIKSWHRRKENA